MFAYDSMTALLVMVAIAAGLAIAARWGWRWRRETIPATCRRCGYDVSHRPAVPPDQLLSRGDACSECGADLAASHAIITQRRRANRWIAVPASVLCVLAMLLLANQIVGFPWREWFYSNAPLPLIIRIARNNPGPTGDPARSAWFRRDDSPAFTDHLLDIQPRVPTTVLSEWSQWIARKLGEEKLSDAQKDRLVRQAFSPASFAVRTPLRQGDPLVLRVTWPGLHIGWGAQIRTFLDARANAPAVIDEKRYWSVGGIPTGTTRSIRAEHWARGNLPPGKHIIHLAVANELVGNDADANWPAISRRIEDHGQLEIEVLPAGTPLGEPIIDASKADEIAQAVSVKVSHWHDERAFAEVELFPATVDRAFSIYAIIDGTETPIGSVAAKAGQRNTSNAIYVPVSVERAKQMTSLTLILVGDGEALKDTPDQTKYWTGRIVYPDIPLGTFKQHYASNQRAPTTHPYRIEHTGPVPPS